VRIHNRVDCCWDRLTPLQLWIGGSSGDFNSATSAACGVDETTLSVTADSAGPFGFKCANQLGQPLTGTHVTLVLPGSSRILNIGEIYAYGT